MDPLTHLLTGAVLSRAGFNRKAAYATAAMTIAAEVPDIDALWSLKGPIAAFEHHRGWTHAFIGIPFEAAVVVGLFWLFHRWRQKRSKPIKQAAHTHTWKATTAAPIHWPRLYLFALIALLSHILLDYTNNYGIRPFFPFNPRWYSASIVFIIEPVITVLLLGALIAPALFGLVSSEVGARRQPFRGRGWAIAALTAIVALWGLRFVERQKALQLAQSADFYNAPGLRLDVLRVDANPHPINPFRWQTITETPLTYQLGAADTLNNTLATNLQADTFYKPPTTLATLVAKRSWLGRIYLDWSPYPLITDTGVAPNGLTAVTFRDLRFLYDTAIFNNDNRKNPPLSGTVFINEDRRVDHMEMAGHIQR
jgi:inner membrane protein